MQRPIRLLLTGGGTGGHLFPAIATAEALCKRLPGSEVLFVGTKRKMDKTSLEQYGFATRSIHSQGLKGKNFISLLQGIAILPVSIIEAMLHIIRFKPDLVLGVGGYVTGPVVLAAKLLGKVTVIHEQNSIPGLANRKLGGLVTKICLSLPGSEKYFDGKKTVLTGNPVRQAILDLSREEKKKNPDKQPTLLVLGGSLGAHRINELVLEACANPKLKGVKIIHQTGLKDVEMVKAAYKKKNIDATVQAFFTDMAAIYKEADCLVSRAGATTLAELAVLGRPAILIPYPYAADNHQEKNAEYYVQGGGALLCVEKALDAKELAENLIALLNDKKTVQKMAKAMRSSAFPDATENIVDECLRCLTSEMNSELV
jgi:UDP-N-acetylglucosamine--N-acetylmuramyl-(pentapeptide) pyrophosphoryl-undecaprenol N-acetylglucosamine transferase